MSITEFTLQSAKELMILFFLLGLIEASMRIVTNTVQMAPDEAITYEEIPDRAAVGAESEQAVITE